VGLSVVIMAGGLATRLGPLAQGNKALVTVGGKPMIAHQLARARAVNADQVIMVIPPNSITLQTAVRHMTRGYRMPIVFTEQPYPRGPADAFCIGVRNVPPGNEALVMMADTWLDEVDVCTLVSREESVCGVCAPLDLYRSWCYPVSPRAYVDGVPHTDTVESVCIGAYFLNQFSVARVRGQRFQGEGMAPLLTYLQLPQLMLSTWLDAGDLGALADARRQMFVRRDHHRLSLDEYGRMTKTPARPGGLHSEARGWEWFRTKWPWLIPQVHTCTPDCIITDFIDHPTLAELLLYWELPTVTWTHIMRTVVDLMWDGPWGVKAPESSATESARLMYVEKTRERMVMAGVEETPLNIALLKVAEEELIDTVIPRYIHGDPNFCNVLFSLGTETVKLVDPRGAWGRMPAGTGDVRYDLAKLRYSYADNFAAINFDEFDQHGIGPTVSPELDLALDDVIMAPFPEVTKRELDIIEALMLFAAVPLHTARQREWLLTAARARAREVIW